MNFGPVLEFLHEHIISVNGRNCKNKIRIMPLVLLVWSDILRQVYEFIKRNFFSLERTRL